MGYYILDVGGGAFPKGNVALDIRAPDNRTVEHYVVGDACHMPFRDKCFVRIVSHGALNYFPSDVLFFQEVSRILRENGSLVISAITYYSFFINLISVSRRNPVGSLRLLLNTLRRRYRWYNSRNLQKTVEKALLTPVRIYPNVSLCWRVTKTPHNILAIVSKQATQ
jgi:SAM-dependent methyltransferase